ncbi:MAG: hypothetical protein QM682_09640 [Paracoccus sp. (in: a-proteobacteria)]|uniref:hypothetical protein n=1 Tax=Paracoccus sp. TaxID=267 RepID=UPI0039E45769
MARARRTSSRRGPRRRSQRRGPSLPLILGAIAAVAIMAGLFVLQRRTETEMAIDADTLCPATGPRAMVAILVDVTDPLAPSQAMKLREYVRREVDRAEVGTEFSLGMVSDDSARLGAQVALCKPHSGGDVTQLTQNVRLVSERYQDRFLKPLGGLFDQMIRASDAKRSPIMEALQALIAGTPGFVTFEGPKRVILVSDLLQHSDAMSFYRGEDWQSFTASPAAQRLSESLGGAEVELFLIPRPAEYRGDPATIEDFWIRYFDHQGAHLPQVHKLGDL